MHLCTNVYNYTYKHVFVKDFCILHKNIFPPLVNIHNPRKTAPLKLYNSNNKKDGASRSVFL